MVVTASRPVSEERPIEGEIIATVNSLLIVGCGDVARRALPWLVRRYRVYALVREVPDKALAPLASTAFRCALDDARSLDRVRSLADTVWHFAPPPAEGEGDPRTRRLLARLARGGRVRRLVYISTTGVYGDCAGRLIDETSPPRPSSARARRRLAAESSLRAFGRRMGRRVCILRAPGIYAADRLPTARLMRGDPVLHASEDVYTHHIHADDLGRIAWAAGVRGRPNRSYNAVDDSQLRMGDYLDRVADRLGLPRPPRRTRAEVRTALSPMAYSFLADSRRLANPRMKRELRVRLRYADVDAGLADVVPLSRNVPASTSR